MESEENDKKDSKRKKTNQISTKASISKELVSELLRDLHNVANLSERDMYLGGIKLSERTKAKSLQDYLDTFRSMGFGDISIIEENKEHNKWIFQGDQLVEYSENHGKPKDNYTLGFLCESLSKIHNGNKVVGVEIECQSAGDKKCIFVLQNKAEVK
ncbi:MAG: hypothetical protein V3V41_02850 [Candidatus Heimdallarchaeota archaeon]